MNEAERRLARLLRENVGQPPSVVTAAQIMAATTTVRRRRWVRAGIPALAAAAVVAIVVGVVLAAGSHNASHPTSQQSRADRPGEHSTRLDQSIGVGRAPRRARRVVRCMCRCLEGDGGHVRGGDADRGVFLAEHH